MYHIRRSLDRCDSQEVPAVGVVVLCRGPEGWWPTHSSQWPEAVAVFHVNEFYVCSHSRQTWEISLFLAKLYVFKIWKTSICMPVLYYWIIKFSTELYVLSLHQTKTICSLLSTLTGSWPSTPKVFQVENLATDQHSLYNLLTQLTQTICPSFLFLLNQQ